MSLTFIKVLIATIGALLVAAVIWDNWRRRAKSSQRSQSLTSSPTPTTTLKQAPWGGNIIVLHVMVNDEPMQGAMILECAERLHLYYGNYHIFHRHENHDGTGGVLFSMASAIEPGTFELENMDDFQTPGLTFFMQYNDGVDPNQAFESMLDAAKALADVFGADIQDAKRQHLSQAAIDDYKQQLLRSA